MFRINYQLKKPNQIVPWGDKEKCLHWFGLTDGLLWLNVGDSVIYEYSDSATLLFDHSIRYNDYQLSRFLEDFSEILPYLAEPIPKFLYDHIDSFDKNISDWEHLYSEKSDDEFFDDFLPNLFEPLYTWYGNRTFDSGHLVGGPIIGCFRYDNNIKIRWNSDYLLKDGNSIWKYPKGIYEMMYSDFASEVSRFFQSFEKDMDKQINDVLGNGIKGVFIDTEQLKKENKLRKDLFTQKVNSLYSFEEELSDWSTILSLYNNMISEINLNHQSLK